MASRGYLKGSIEFPEDGDHPGVTPPSRRPRECQRDADVTSRLRCGDLRGSISFPEEVKRTIASPAPPWRPSARPTAAHRAHSGGKPAYCAAPRRLSLSGKELGREGRYTPQPIPASAPRWSRNKENSRKKSSKATKGRLKAPGGRTHPPTPRQPLRPRRHPHNAIGSTGDRAHPGAAPCAWPRCRARWWGGQDEGRSRSGLARVGRAGRGAQPQGRDSWPTCTF